VDYYWRSNPLCDWKSFWISIKMKKKKKYHKNIKKIVSFRRQGEIVRLSIYTAHEGHQKHFEAEAPANDPKKVGLLLKAAFSKGMARPKFDDDEYWFD